YSSGMYVRLAFAVAAHLEPEILIVDEVLAVGDTEFQKKCIGKMSEVAGHGRTVLFVSHNMAALRRICDLGIVLSGGRIVLHGELGQCIEKYNGSLNRSNSEGRLHFPSTSRETHHIIDIEILDDKLVPIPKLTTWEPAVFLIRFYSPRRTPNAAVTFQVSTMDGSLITFCATMPDQGFGVSFEEGENRLLLRFKSIALSAGNYVIGAGLAVANTHWLYNEPQAATVEVAAKDIYNAGFAPTMTRYPVPMECHWEKMP
ncbi:MAG: ABC transporter ATP-binding protein, partial [Ktedonobacteraceae bacterium]